MLRMLLFSLVIVALVAAGTVPEGGLCSSSNNHLDPGSLKFLSECNDQTFCSASINGTCVPRQCRRDEFPFGFSSVITLPPLCSPGSFCPDEGSGCKPLAAFGQPCQLNRDEQCAPPLDWQDLASSQNFNGSICLHSTCMYANVTLGLPCLIDNITYTNFDPNGQQYQRLFTRDNCHTPQFYCDYGSVVCQRTKKIGLPCVADQECETHNCGTNEVCEEPPETPLKVAPWQYAVTGLCIFGAMIATCIMLTLIHKRHRLENYKEVQDYYYEQLELRHSIIALHTAAADRYDSDSKNRYTIINSGVVRTR